MGGQYYAVAWNVYDWVVTTFGLSRLAGPRGAEAPDPAWGGYCVFIGRPGGVGQVRFRELADDECTVGYNIPGFSKVGGGCVVRHTADKSDLPDDCVIMKTKYFSVNFADVCIRWGLYESANRFVGFPIVPGFDVSGEVAWVGKGVTHLAPGDRVFGCTLFGGYSTRVLVPARQLRKVPEELPMATAAALPAVAFTAIHALNLAGVPASEGGVRLAEATPSTAPYASALPWVNKAVLVHSAAGGVGSILCKLACHLGYGPVVGVVGREAKVAALQKLCPSDALEVVQKKDLWKTPATDRKFAAVFDANGQETLRHSFDHLAQGGRLVTYGYHTNLPTVGGSISPLQWLKMLGQLFTAMPHFDPMVLSTNSKAVLGFNLSFFDSEYAIQDMYFDALLGYVRGGVLDAGSVAIDVQHARDIRAAHEKLSSGTTVGKLVMMV